jgi:hypothetical protein
MPGQSDGICIRNSRIASVPPVEAPMMISFSDEVSADLVGDQFGVLAHPALDRDLRLGDEVDRTEFERAHRDFRTALGQRGHHQHRHRPQAHQLLQEVEAIHLRHLDVEREHVGIGFLDQFARNERIGGGAHDFHVGLRIDDLAHHAADQGRVVDDQDLGFHCVSQSEQIRTNRFRRPRARP